MPPHKRIKPELSRVPYASGCLKPLSLTANPIFMKTAVLFSAAFLLTACAAVPDVPRDMAEIPVPAQWRNAPAAQNTFRQPENWWTHIQDTRLKQALERARAHNTDIAVAALNLQKALLLADSATADMLPSLSANASGSVSKNLDGGASGKKFTSAADITFQADLFGKLRQSRNMRVLLAQASAAGRHNIELGIISQTASLYWQIAALNHRIGLAEKNIAQSQEILNLLQERYAAGATAYMEVLQAGQSLREQKNQLDTLTEQKSRLISAFNILLGNPPQNSVAAAETLEEIALPALPENLPAAVLDNRPDIRAARLNLMAQGMNVDIAVRQFFPVLNLNAGVSAGGVKISQITQDPAGALSLNLLLPFLNIPDNILNLKTAQTDYRLYLAQYRQTLYRALGEVEDALAEQIRLEAQSGRLHENLAAAGQLEKIRAVRYRSGADSLQDWLNAQTATRNAEAAVIENRLARYQNFLTRYTALGGQLSAES